MKWEEFDPNKLKNSEGIKEFENLHEKLQTAIIELKKSKAELEEKRDNGELAK